MKNFTERELEVLYWLIKGLNNNEIADKLCISIHTVKAHLASIYDKLKVYNRVQAAVKAVQLNIFDLEDVVEK